jgi:outer membrane protein OmpA-like peptidoglycan-associated protein
MPRSGHEAERAGTPTRAGSSPHERPVGIKWLLGRTDLWVSEDTGDLMRLALFFVAVGALVTAASSARADSLGLRPHVIVAGGHALGGHQQKELSWGAAGLGAAELGLSRGLGVELEVGYLRLWPGKAPDNAILEPLGSAAALHGALGVRLAPFEWTSAGPTGGAGFWLSAAGGAARTGGLTRPMLDAWLGYDFALSSGGLLLGPTAGWVHVFQPNSAPRPDDANVLLVGVHGSFGSLGAAAEADGDRDHDRIKDSVDRCPDNPEDYDGFEDEDGCPELDNDHDGIPDTSDACPCLAEDKDGFEDEDGCPEDDNDKDKILDAVDQCPNDPEDYDDFQDADGCPDLDNDKDGIPDVKDKCPNEPETVNGYADEDGCPDEQQVRVLGDKILLDDRIHFPTNSAVILRDSFGLMQRLAKLIMDHPEYVHVEILGRADPRGPASFNLKLSQARADSVRDFLIKEGIEPGRLSAVGLGETAPAVTTENDFALYMERRVEFNVTREHNATPGAPEQPSSEAPAPDLEAEAAKVPQQRPAKPAPASKRGDPPPPLPPRKQEGP